MSKPPDNSDPSKLRDGWEWAVWAKTEETKLAWRDLDERTRAAFRVRKQYVELGAFTGKRVSHHLCYETGGVGKLKVTHPSPGVRCWYFRDGRKHYITHFTDKGDEDHNEAMQLAQAIKELHFSKKAKPKKRK